MMFKTLFVLALTLLTVTNAISKDLVKVKDFPTWFRASLSREANIQSTSKLSIPELDVAQQVKGKIQLVEQKETYWYFNLDIGTSLPVECYVFTDFDGAATSMYSVINHTINANVTLNNKPLSGKYNFALDAGAINNTPYLALDTMYTLGEGKNKVMGLIKAISAQTARSLQICVHNEIGYRDSFFTLAESFITAIEKSSKEQTFFQPIYKLSSNGVPVGFARERFKIDKEGDIHIQSEQSLLMPMAGNKLLRTDNMATAWSRTDGSLINGSSYKIENSTVASSYTIKKTNDKWVVDGQLGGKVFKKTLAYNQSLLSDYGTYVASKVLLSSNNEHHSYYMWLADSYPSIATIVQFSKVKEPGVNLKIEKGPAELKYFAESAGIFQNGSITQGPIKLDVKLIHQSGSPILN